MGWTLRVAERMSGAHSDLSLSRFLVCILDNPIQNRIERDERVSKHVVEIYPLCVVSHSNVTFLRQTLVSRLSAL